MKNKLRILAMFLVVLITLSAFSACGSKSPASTEPSKETSTETSEEKNETETNPSGAIGEIEEDAKLVYWTMWNETEPQGIVIQEAVDAFTEATGVEVDINFNGRDIRKTLEPALAGGEEIDLFDEDIERVLNAWGDYLLPLDELVDASYENTGGKPYRSVINNTLITLAEDLGAAKGFSDGGKIHNIPYQPSTFVVMYNKDLFESAGITDVPKTWDEFLDVCAKLKEKDITAITVDDAYIAGLFGYTMDRIVGDEKTYDMIANKDFSDPGVLRAAEIWENMAKEGYISSKAATNVYPAGQVDEIAKGTVAMYLNGTWLPNEIKSETPDMNWGSFAWPAIDSDGDGVEANNFGAQSFGIHKDTKYPNAAFALVRHLTVGEWDQKLSDESMGVPMANDATWPPQLADAKSVIDTSTKRLNWAVGMEDDSDINATLKESFAKLVLGEYTAQQFADALGKLK